MENFKVVQAVLWIICFVISGWMAPHGARAQDSGHRTHPSVYDNFASFFQAELNAPHIRQERSGLHENPNLHVSLHLGAHTVSQMDLLETNDHRLAVLEYEVQRQVVGASLVEVPGQPGTLRWDPSGRALILLSGGDQPADYHPALDAINRSIQKAEALIYKAVDSTQGVSVWLALVVSQTPNEEMLHQLAERGVRAVIVQNPKNEGSSGQRWVEIDYIRALSGARSLRSGHVWLWGGGNYEFQRAAELALRWGHDARDAFPWELRIYENQNPHSSWKQDHAQSAQNPNACMRLLHALGGRLISPPSRVAIEVIQSVGMISGQLSVKRRPFESYWSELPVVLPEQSSSEFSRSSHLASYGLGGLSARAIDAQLTGLKKLLKGPSLFDRFLAFVAGPESAHLVSAEMNWYVNNGPLTQGEYELRERDLLEYERYGREIAQQIQPLVSPVIEDQNQVQRQETEALARLKGQLLQLESRLGVESADKEVQRMRALVHAAEVRKAQLDRHLMQLEQTKAEATKLLQPKRTGRR